jgi:drug/metabolite transporter (DMT)-like permease
MLVKGYIYAAASAISFGLIPLFVIPIKRAGISMDVTLFYRFLLAAIMIGIYILIRKGSLKLRTSDLPKLIFMGMLYALSAEFLFLGYDAMSAGIASTVLYIYPLIVAGILYLGFGERISLTTKISMALALIGVMILSWEGENMKFNWIGTLIVLGSALAYALYMIVVNKGRLHASGIVITFYSVLFSAVFYAIKSVWVGESLVLNSPYWLGFISVFSLITVVISVLFIVLAINLIGSTPTAVLGALEPVVAVWISVLFFGEKATSNLLIGLIVIIGALIVNVLGVTKSRKQSL